MVMRVLSLVAFYEAGNNGAFSQQLSVVAHTSADAYASHVEETVEGFKYKRVVHR